MDIVSFNFDFVSVGIIGVFFFIDNLEEYSLIEGIIFFEFCFIGEMVGVFFFVFINSLVFIYISDEFGNEFDFMGGDGQVEIFFCFDIEIIIDMMICDGEIVVVGGIVFMVEGQYEILL